MALPLPNILTNVGPGGPVVTALRGGNALLADILENKYNAVKAKYAPLTIPAEGLSKLAYYNLAGPQFTAKMLENAYIAGNLTPEQYRAGLQKVYNAGIGGGGNDIANSLLQNVTNESLSPFENMVNNVSKAFGFGNAPSQNAMINPPPRPQMMPQANMPVNAGYSYDNQGNNVRATPQQVASIANEDLSKIGTGDENTPAENAGNFLGTVKQREEQGKIRAESIKSADDDYKQSLISGQVIDHLIDSTNDPVFENMRNKIPNFQDRQLWWLSKHGTKEEQDKIGDFTTSTNTAVANTVNSFGGRALVKEFDMGEKMKISNNDTFNVIQGKLKTIKMYSEMSKRRNKIASELMNKGMNEGKAYEQADKSVDGKAIRAEIDKNIKSIRAENDKKLKPNDDDINFMSKKYNISPDEVKKRLKAKGLL